MIGFGVEGVKGWGGGRIWIKGWCWGRIRGGSGFLCLMGLGVVDEVSRVVVRSLGETVSGGGGKVDYGGGMLRGGCWG